MSAKTTDTAIDTGQTGSGMGQGSAGGGQAAGTGRTGERESWPKGGKQASLGGKDQSPQDHQHMGKPMDKRQRSSDQEITGDTTTTPT